MHAFFRFQVAIGIATGDQQRGAFDACLVAVLEIHRFHTITVAFGIAHVHPQQHLGPVLGFGATGSGVQGENRVVRIILAGQHQRKLQLLDVMLQFLDHRLQLRLDAVVILFHAQVPQRRDVAVTLLQVIILFDRPPQRRQIAHHFLRRLRVFPQVVRLGDPLQAGDLDFLFGYVKETSGGLPLVGLAVQSGLSIQIATIVLHS